MPANPSCSTSWSTCLARPALVFFLLLCSVSISTFLSGAHVVPVSLLNIIYPAILVIFSVYAVAVPFLRVRGLRAQHPVWLKLSLAVAISFSIASLAVYHSDQEMSIVLAYMAGVAQLATLLQLVDSVHEYARARGGLQEEGTHGKDLEKGKENPENTV